MKELRQYRHFFDEEPNILRPKDNIYSMDLKFDFDTQMGELIIPDCGGMMDMVPKSSQQEAFVKNLVLQLEHKQTWATVWKLLNRNAYDSIVDKLKETSTPSKSFELIIKANEIKKFIAYIEEQKIQPTFYRCSSPTLFYEKTALSSDSFAKLKQVNSWQQLKALLDVNLNEEETEIEWYFM